MNNNLVYKGHPFLSANSHSPSLWCAVYYFQFVGKWAVAMEIGATFIQHNEIVLRCLFNCSLVLKQSVFILWATVSIEMALRPYFTCKYSMMDLAKDKNLVVYIVPGLRLAQ